MGIEAFIKSISVQTAVYWGNPQSDGYGGTTFATPIEAECRWDNVTKVISDSKGKQTTSLAEVLVNQDMVAGGYLFLGTLADLTTAEKANPLIVQTAYEIKRFDKTPMIKSTTEFVRKAYL